MFPRHAAPYASSDVPPYYSPTDLISHTTVPPLYTETAATTTTEPAVVAPNVTTPKPRRRRRRRRENCPLSSHQWVLWLLWLYCSALFAVEIVELKRLFTPFFSLLHISTFWGGFFFPFLFGGMKERHYI